MKIAIEAQRIFRTNKHGMDFVALETIRRLQKLDKENEYFILVGSGEDRCLEPSANMHIVEVHCPTYPLWEQFALPLALKKIKPDILHCTSNTAPVCCGIPLVLTLHDIIFLEKKASKNKSLYQNLGWHYRRLVVPKVLNECMKIITVSEYEKERIVSELHPCCEVIAIHNGFSDHFRLVADTVTVTRKYLPEERYIFFLGNTDPKKNTARTLAAYAVYLKNSSAPLPLLIADLNGNIVDSILKETGLEEIRPFLRCPGYISNTDLPAVYGGASVFLYTSLRESFGIPTLEAMACGTPVITSDTSAIPEVAGSGAILVVPHDENAIAEALLRLENDDEYRRSAVEYGLERVKNFSWDKTAAKLLEVYKNIGALRNR